jgi:RNase P/RNase MRP subunit p29
MKKIIRVVSLAGLFCAFAQAAIPSTATIIGKVESVSDKTVTLKTETGAVRVPRSAIESRAAIRFGNMVRAHVTFEALRRLNG